MCATAPWLSAGSISGLPAGTYTLAAVHEKGQPLFIVLNGADEAVDVTFPEWPNTAQWQRVLDTSDGQSNADAGKPGETWSAQARAILAFAGAP